MFPRKDVDNIAVLKRNKKEREKTVRKKHTSKTSRLPHSLCATEKLVLQTVRVLRICQERVAAAPANVACKVSSRERVCVFLRGFWGVTTKSGWWSGGTGEETFDKLYTWL